MAIAEVQAVTGNGATLALNGVVAGNALFVQSSYISATAASTPTDSNGTLAVASDDTPAGGVDPAGAAIWHEKNTASGTHSISALPANHESAVSEFSGLDTVNLFDVAKSANSVAGGQTSQVTGTTLTTAVANELVLISFCDDASPGAANMGLTDPVSGFTTLQVVQNSATDIGTHHSYKIISSTGTQTATENWTDTSATQGSMACIATFQGTSGTTNNLAWVKG